MLPTLANNKTLTLSRIAPSILGTGLLLSAPGATTLLTGCNLCSDELLGTVISPDGHLVAETKLRDCGATTAETLTITVRRNRNFLNQEISVFAIKHDHRVNVTWQDDDHLKIKCGECEANEIIKEK